MILIVTSSWPRTGDEIAGTFVRTDALARVAEGPVVVAAPRGPGVARGGPGLRIVDVPHLGLLGSPGAAHRLRAAPGRIAGLLPWTMAIASLVVRERPTALVAHWLLPAGLVARLAAPGLPIELVAHGADVRLLEALPRPIARSLLLGLARGATLRAVSEGIRARLRGIAALPIAVAPMPLAASAFARARARASELHAHHGEELHVVVARCVPEKRIERAFAHVPAGGTFALIGDGPEAARIVREARARGLRTIATGAVAHDEALAWIAAARLVIAPLAAGEGAPTVVREARALGRPVVVIEGSRPAATGTTQHR